MKKTYSIILAVTGVSLLAIGNANANNLYLGAGYDQNIIDYKDDQLGGSSVDLGDYYEQNKGQINFFAGIDQIANSNISAEISYFKAKEDKSNNNTGLIWTDTLNPLETKATTELETISLNAIYNISLQDDLDFLALGGYSHMTFESHNVFLDLGAPRLESSEKDKGYSINIGLGLSKKLNDNFSVRGIAKYSDTNNIDDIKNIVSYQLGFKYSF